MARAAGGNLESSPYNLAISFEKQCKITIFRACSGLKQQENNNYIKDKNNYDISQDSQNPEILKGEGFH